MAFNKDLLKTFPSSFGVYIMKDINEQILYIGKAKNLKARIKQYFFQKDTRASIPFLISKIETINVIVVNNSKEALILENNLIKKFQPKYNILLKDDKTYISIKINKSHTWPMLSLVRLKSLPKDQNLYFGPYTSAFAAKSIKDLLLNIFPLRQCSDTEIQNRTRPCILYDIKKCLAPCVKKDIKKQYDTMIDNIVLFLKGKNRSILKMLKQKMQKASDNLEYEKAQKYLNLIKQIKDLMQEQLVQNFVNKNLDVIGLYRTSFNTIIVKLIFQNGKMLNSSHFSFFEIASNDFDVLQNFIYQEYKNIKNFPKEILIPLKIANQKELQDLLYKNHHKKITITCPIKGKKKDLINLANANAKTIFKQQNQMQDLKEKLLLELYQICSLVNYPKHIICFDISNISQKFPVGAMVTFIDGKKDKAQTKLFKILSLKQGDTNAMQEVLKRHFSKITKLPDLLIVDGAKAQLNIAKKTLDTLKIASVDILAISKEKAKHTKSLTQEKIFVPDKKEPILIQTKSPILFLLQQIRDEAHRAAISFHKKSRAQQTIKSSITTIPGIGRKKMQALLKNFKSIENLKKATQKDLQNIKVLNNKDIEQILTFCKKQ